MRFYIRDSLSFAFRSTPAMIFFSFSICYKHPQSFGIFSYSVNHFNTGWIIWVHCPNAIPYIVFMFSLIYSSISMYSVSDKYGIFFFGMEVSSSPYQYYVMLFYSNISFYPLCLLPHTSHILHCQTFSPRNPLVSLQTFRNQFQYLICRQ